MAGMSVMKKVISLSVFDNEKNAHRPGYYWQHLRHSIWGYLNLFPGWEIWLYHDNSLYNNHYGGAILNMQDRVKLIYIGQEKAICKAMLRRLEPLFDSSVEYLLCRDVDHWVTIRERVMVEQFIESGKALQTIHDHPAHSCSMLGGLISFNVPKTRQLIKGDFLDGMLKAYGWTSGMLMEHGTDQEFMNRELWPILKESSCEGTADSVHDIDTCTPFMGTAVCDAERYYEQLQVVGDTESALYITKAENTAFINTHFTHLNMEMACTNKRRVALATNESIDYFFFMPIVSMLWQYYIGYCPVIMIVGTLEEWMNDPQRRLSLQESRKTGAEIHFISGIEGHRTASVAQNSRLYASCLPMYCDSMYLVLSDMDMLPLNREWFNKQDMTKRVHLDYSNVYNHIQYPLCYVGCNVATWQEIMKPINPNSMADSLRQQFQDDNIIEETDGMKLWCYDERMFGEKIKAWSGYPDQCQMFDRYGCPPTDRIDRSCWPDSFENMVDCHSVRPGHTHGNWEKILPVLQTLMSGKHIEILQKYRTDFNGCIRDSYTDGGGISD